MTNTEKRQDLFNGNFMNNGVEGVLDDKFQDPKMLIVRDFHTESIQQALAEERERVVEIVNFIDYDFLADLSNEEKYPVEYAVNFERRRIRILLSSLDKPKDI